MPFRFLVLSVLGFATASAQQPGNHRIEQLAPGVHAVLRLDPIAFVNNANSLVVVGDGGVLVVDAQFTRKATLETIAAIRSLTPQPIRYVVITHWHDDHFGGVQVYRDSFPGVRIVAHANTRTDLQVLGGPNRNASWNVGPSFTARFERLLAQGLGVDSTRVSDGERKAMENVIAVGRQYVAEKDGFRETLPGITFDDQLSLYLGARRVDVHWFGVANTRGDAVVHVPDAKVVATGDLLVHPVPFAFNAFVTGWRDALDSVRALQPVAIVPGHGPVFRDHTYLRMVRNALDAVHTRTFAALSRGASRDQARTQVNLDDVRAYFTGDDPWLVTLFTRFYLEPAKASALEQISIRQ